MSEIFHGLKLRGFLASQDTKEMEMNSCLLWWGGERRGFQLWVNAAPHVRSLLILSPLEMRNVTEQNKLPLKNAFVGDQEKSRAQLESKGKVQGPA